MLRLLIVTLLLLLIIVYSQTSLSGYPLKWISSVWSRLDTHTRNGPLSGTTQVGRYKKGNTNLDFTDFTKFSKQTSRFNPCYAPAHPAHGPSAYILL